MLDKFLLLLTLKKILLLVDVSIKLHTMKMKIHKMEIKHFQEYQFTKGQTLWTTQ